MGTFSIWHILILALVVFLLFGSGRVSDLMGDVAKGIKNFKKGLAEDDDPKVIGSERHPPDQAAGQKDQTKDKVG